MLRPIFHQNSGEPSSSPEPCIVPSVLSAWDRGDAKAVRKGDKTAMKVYEQSMVLLSRIGLGLGSRSRQKPRAGRRHVNSMSTTLFAIATHVSGLNRHIYSFIRPRVLKQVHREALFFCLVFIVSPGVSPFLGASWNFPERNQRMR
jgi:hypothetical protein